MCTKIVWSPRTGHGAEIVVKKKRRSPRFCILSLAFEPKRVCMNRPKYTQLRPAPR